MMHLLNYLKASMEWEMTTTKEWALNLTIQASTWSFRKSCQVGAIGFKIQKAKTQISKKKFWMLRTKSLSNLVNRIAIITIDSFSKCRWEVELQTKSIFKQLISPSQRILRKYFKTKMIRLTGVKVFKIFEETQEELQVWTNLES